MTTGSVVGEQIQFALKDFNAHLTCTLCNGYFHEAHTIPECMHTFCRVCILKHFYLNKNRGAVTCPTCGIKLGPYVSANSKVIYDRNLQSIVDKLFPYFMEREKEEYEQFLLTQDLKLKRAATDSAAVTTEDGNSTKKKKEVVDEYHFRMVADVGDESNPALPSLQKPCLKVALTTKVATIQKFVYKRLDEEQQKTLKDEFRSIDIVYEGKLLDPTSDLSFADGIATTLQAPIVLTYLRKLER